MKKVDASFNLPDGRLNPEKAFAFVIEKTKSMTPEEFTATFNAPTKFQALAEAAEREKRKPAGGQVLRPSDPNTIQAAKTVQRPQSVKDVKNAIAALRAQKVPKKKKPASG